MSHKLNINIFDCNFIGYQDASVKHKTSKYTEYAGKRGQRRLKKFDGITIFTDHCFKLVDTVQSKIKIAWQVETPPLSNGPFYRMLEQGYGDKFDYIITYDDDLINENPDKYLRGNFGGTQVVDPALYPKKKDACIIASGRKQLPGHKLRHQIIEKFPQIDAYGNGVGKPFKHQETIYNDYRFAVVVENVRNNNYFSEKITDAFACGCIPVYCGCPNVTDTFDSNGIIEFETLEDLEKILPTLTESLYNEKIEAVRNNFNKTVEQFNTTEDWLYLTYFRSILEKHTQQHK